MKLLAESFALSFWLVVPIYILNLKCCKPNQKNPIPNEYPR